MHLAALLLLASAFWGQTPACGQPSISTAHLSVLSNELEVLGRSDPADCRIIVDSSRFRRRAGWACMVILHEDGHLLNYYDPEGFRWPDGRIDHSHSPDPNNIMYPIISRPVWPCLW